MKTLMKLEPLLKLVFAASQIALLIGMTLNARADERTHSAIIPRAQTSDFANASEKFSPYRPRFGRQRPLIVVVGENSGTELTDFVVPYAVLKKSEAADVVTVATNPGRLKLRPALQILPDFTTARFDARYPDGADYVIVPAVVKQDDAVLIAWISKQSALGATLVSICDGALVVARTGLLDGHRATAHWASEDARKEKYPNVRWVNNTRYVADRNFASSAGVSAATPISIALVEAIAGEQRAAALANALGVTDWGSHHNSDVFQPKFGVNLMALITTNFTNAWLYRPEHIGIPVSSDVDEMALALAADAYSRSGRTQVFALGGSNDPIQLRNGLVVLPDRVIGRQALDRILPGFEGAPAALALDSALEDIAHRYGETAAYGVALTLEYPRSVR